MDCKKPHYHVVSCALCRINRKDLEPNIVYPSTMDISAADGAMWITPHKPGCGRLEVRR